MYVVGAATPAVVMAWPVAVGGIRLVGGNPGGGALLCWPSAVASWVTSLVLVTTRLALVLERVAMIFAWLSMVSDLTVATQARVLNDSPSFLAISSRTFCSTDASEFFWRVAVLAYMPASSPVAFSMSSLSASASRNHCLPFAHVRLMAVSFLNHT